MCKDGCEADCSACTMSTLIEQRQDRSWHSKTGGVGNHVHGSVAKEGQRREGRNGRPDRVEVSRD
jgi:hypothetical protein